jgi:hypothetical protein
MVSAFARLQRVNLPYKRKEENTNVDDDVLIILFPFRIKHPSNLVIDK